MSDENTQVEMSNNPPVKITLSGEAQFALGKIRKQVREQVKVANIETDEATREKMAGLVDELLKASGKEIEYERAQYLVNVLRYARSVDNKRAPTYSKGLSDGLTAAVDGILLINHAVEHGKWPDGIVGDGDIHFNTAHTRLQEELTEISDKYGFNYKTFEYEQKKPKALNAETSQKLWQSQQKKNESNVSMADVIKVIDERITYYKRLNNYTTADTIPQGDLTLRLYREIKNQLAATKKTEMDKSKVKDVIHEVRKEVVKPLKPTDAKDINLKGKFLAEKVAELPLIDKTH